MVTVYVFTGFKAKAPSAVFTDKKKAIKRIKYNKLSGTLNELPLDISAYDHAVESGLFLPKKDHEKSAAFMAGFSPRLWHGHFGPEFDFK